jgi:uncharacterized protein
MGLTPSIYNLRFSLGHRWFVFNSLWSSLCELDDEAQQILTCTMTEEPDPETTKLLQSAGFLVSEASDELGTYLELYDASKQNDGTLYLKLMLATGCNLRCKYCYQDSPSKPIEVISESAIARLTRWVKNELESGSVARIAVEMYGGEPLLGRARIPLMLSSFEDICRTYNAPIEWSIVTNGTLLTQELAELFIRKHVNIQLTVDGEEDQHNKRRPWKRSGLGTFHRVLRSIRLILKYGGADLLQVRMNIDQSNLSDVRNLALRLKAMGVKQFHCGWIHFQERNTAYAADTIDERDLDGTVGAQLFRTLEPLGFASSPTNLERRTTCMFHWYKGFVVTPSLELFKCDELVGMSEHQVGLIDETGHLVLFLNEYMQQTARSVTAFEQCLSCRLLPMCGGGCPVKALNTRGDINSSHCEVTLQSLEERLVTQVSCTAT